MTIQQAAGTLSFNGTTTMYNSLNGKILTVIPGMSDVHIVSQLCMSYSFWALAMTGITLLLFFLKGTMHHFSKRAKPENKENLIKIRDSADGIIEGLLIMFTVIQFLIALNSYLG